MTKSINPTLDYILCEVIKEETGAVSSADVADHWQKYKVLAVGPGRYDNGIFIEPVVREGNVIYVQKHSEADTPPELEKIGQALIMGSRVMAVEG